MLCIQAMVTISFGCFIIGLGPDEELPEYDLDSEDEEWLSVQSRERVCC